MFCIRIQSERAKNLLHWPLPLAAPAFEYTTDVARRLGVRASRPSDRHSSGRAVNRVGKPSSDQRLPAALATKYHGRRQGIQLVTLANRQRDQLRHMARRLRALRETNLMVSSSLHLTFALDASIPLEKQG